MAYEQVTLSDGFAYCEVRNIYTKTKEGAPLASKKGDPMITVQWSVVDKDGNNGTIRDYLVSSAGWKIDNYENVLGITGLFNKATNRFNDALLLRKACGATIKQDENPDYGSKLVMLVPLNFFTLLNGADKETDEAIEENYKQSTSRHKHPLPVGLKDEEIDLDSLPF